MQTKCDSGLAERIGEAAKHGRGGGSGKVSQILTVILQSTGLCVIQGV